MTSTAPARLPAMCAARLPVTGRPIAIVYGERGYYPQPDGFPVEAFNARAGITAAQVEAMLIGSMFGWTVPGVARALEAEP